MAEAGKGDQVAGAALMIAAGAVVLAMTHHPTSGHSALNGPVHGAMIGLVGVMAYGFAQFARSRGLDRPAVLAGLVAYAIASVAHIVAASINGFVVPAMGHDGIGHELAHFGWAMNQAFAYLGVVATGVAYLLWSSDFLRRPGLEARIIGVLGLAAGAVPVALLVVGALRMNVAGALIVYAADVGWAALVGWHLWRGRAASL